MAEQVLKDVGIWIDGVDYAGVSNSVGIDLTAAAPVSTRFKGGWVRRAAGGLKTAALSMEGFLDTDGPGAAQYASLGTEKSVMIVPAGQVAGDVAFVVPVAVSGHSPLGGGVGELAAWTYAAEGDGPDVPGAGAGHPGGGDGGQCHGAGEPRADSHRRDAGSVGARHPQSRAGTDFRRKCDESDDRHGHNQGRRGRDQHHAGGKVFHRRARHRRMVATAVRLFGRQP